MTRQIRIEAPADLTLKLFMQAFSGTGTPDPLGYDLTEVFARAYEAEMTDDELLGIFYCAWKIELDSGWETINAGYVTLEADANTYAVTPTPTITADSTFSAYGPKRVKTKEMEIEQFDPILTMKATERTAATLPSFADGNSAVGRGKRCRHIGPDNY